jgi:hypothetical protein
VSDADLDNLRDDLPGWAAEAEVNAAASRIRRTRARRFLLSVLVDAEPRGGVALDEFTAHGRAILGRMNDQGVVYLDGDRARLTRIGWHLAAGWRLP